MDDEIPFDDAPEPGQEEYPFTPVFIEKVAGPWQEECLESDYPWEATPALRHQWRQLAASGRVEEKEAGIVALVRCANQTPEEKAIVDAFIEGDETFQSVPVGAAIDLMLTGASPSQHLYPIFWGKSTPAEICSNHFLAEMTSLWSRHPSSLLYVKTIAEQVVHGENHFCWGVNPLIGTEPLDRLTKMGGETPWWPAVAAFTSKDTTLERIEKAHSPLELFGICLRPHLTAEQWEAILQAGLDGDMAFAYLEHPAGMGEPCPAERDWLNPSRNLIEYAKIANSLGTIWRYWMPTLNYPWFREATDGIRDLPQLLGLTLVGKPYDVLLEQARTEGHLGFERLAQQHPTCIMEEVRTKRELEEAKK